MGFKFIDRIGAGGFGNVDLVEDAYGQRYAKKTFNVNQPGGMTADLVENVKRRFIREADVQSGLVHNNIMPVIVKNLCDNPPSFIMPLAESTLADDMAYDPSLGGNALQAIMDILSGLEELHSQGIYHRDLKPQNVLRIRTEQGCKYVISDFGLMSIKDTQLTVLTQTGMGMGSDYYTAPEIVADLRMASAGSDIYSVGCILHDFFGNTTRIPCAEAQDTGFYGDIINCCTRRDVLRRFKTVSDLRDAIVAQGHTSVPTEPVMTGFINLVSSSEPLDYRTWERIVEKVITIHPSHDSDAFFGSFTLTRISEVVELYPVLAARIGPAYSEWVKRARFDFSTCDAIANRLIAFTSVNDVNCQAEAILALLFMGTLHNRWYVEHKFVAFCGANMPIGLAKRIALEIRVSKDSACRAIHHLEYSIGFSRNGFHPQIAAVLNQVC